MESAEGRPIRPPAAVTSDPGRKRPRRASCPRRAGPVESPTRCPYDNEGRSALAVVSQPEVAPPRLTQSRPRHGVDGGHQQPRPCTRTEVPRASAHVGTSTVGDRGDCVHRSCLSDTEPLASRVANPLRRSLGFTPPRGSGRCGLGRPSIHRSRDGTRSMWARRYSPADHPSCRSARGQR
jgi:hypothetical protein